MYAWISRWCRFGVVADADADADADLSRGALEQCTADGTPHWPEPGKKILCKVLSVYDGDTLRVAIYLGGGRGAFQFPVRLHGYDAPEIKGRDRSEPEKFWAKECQRMLAALVLGRLCYLVPRARTPNSGYATDKYGRILGTLYVNGPPPRLGALRVRTWDLESGQALDDALNVNSTMMRILPCTPYDGQGKKPVCDYAVWPRSRVQGIE